MNNKNDDASLSISCVTFYSDKILLKKVIESLANSCWVAKNNRIINHTELYLIDNGPDESNLKSLQTIKNASRDKFDKITIISGHGNVGYGKGNNLAIDITNCSFHLIINPDVIVDDANISTAVSYLTSDKKVAIVTPHALDENGNPHYIAKRYPRLLVLLARALKLRLMQKMLAKQLYTYEYRDRIPASAPLEIELASGCYMLCRTASLKQINGFNPLYFMYFEDFDLSIRMKKIGKIVHLPELHIVHFGGKTSSKGALHIYYFCISLCKFFKLNKDYKRT